MAGAQPITLYPQADYFGLQVLVVSYPSAALVEQRGVGQPTIDFFVDCEHRGIRPSCGPMDGKAEHEFPSLDSTHTSVQIAGDFFSPLQYLGFTHATLSARSGSAPDGANPLVGIPAPETPKSGAREGWLPWSPGTAAAIAQAGDNIVGR